MRAMLFALAGALVLGVGCTPEQKPPEPPPPAPRIESFTVTPSTVSAGEKVKLEWKTSNATSVELQQAGKGVVSGAEGLSGSVEVTVQEDALFVLTAKNARGVSESRAATVDVVEAADEVIFVASPEEISAGQPVTLAWSANGAREVSLATADGTAVDLGGQKTAGAVTVTPAVTTTYVLTVDGKTYEASVRVRPVVNAFASSPASAKPGEDLALSWKTTGATQVKVSLAGNGELLTETDAAKVADGTLNFTVPADIDPAAALSFRLVASNADGATTTAELTVYVTGAPKLREVTVPPYVREGGTFTVSWKSTGADGLQVLQDGAVVYVAPDLASVDEGKVELHAKAQDTVVQVRALNSRGGQDESDSFTVNPVGTPTIDQFDVSPTAITNGGDPVTITWNVPSARHLTIAARDQFLVHTVDGVSAETGTLTVYPNVPTEYVLTADNGIGDKVTQTSALVTVTTPATVTFSVASAPAGAPIQITGTTVAGGGDLTGLPFINAGPDAFVDIASAANDTNFDTWRSSSAMGYTLAQTFTGMIGGAPVNASHLSISPNGWFVFTAGTESGPDGPSAETLEGDLPAQAVAPLFADLQSHTGAAVYARVDSDTGEQRLIVQWNDFQHENISGTSLTFQAQVYASGRVVFAYQTITGLNSTYAVRMGVVSADGKSSESISLRPASGDVMSWGTTLTPPIDFLATDTPFAVKVAMPGGGFLRIDDVRYPMLPPNQFSITEANHFPAAGHGEWFEVSNNTASPFDLNGWTIDFGGGSTHTIGTSLILPANGTLLLGQDADAAEASAGGPAIDYVYGPGYSMEDGAGSVALVKLGVPYAQLSWPTGAAQGVSWEPYVTGPGETWGAGTPSCPTSTYGSGAQSGTPGVQNSNCFPYRMSVDTSDPFFPLATSPGSQVVGTLSGSSGTDSSVQSITLARPVPYFGNTYSTLWVSSNGFVGVMNPTSSYNGNNTSLSTSNPNGVLAPLWDDLKGSSTGSVRWQQFDPDASPGSGDEYTIVSFEHWQYWLYSGDFNFQVVFFEGSGDIEYRYGTMTSTDTYGYAQGSSATTWLEDPTGTLALIYNVNSDSNPGITPNTTIHFTAQ